MTSKKSNAKSTFSVGLKAIAYVLAFLLALYAVPTNVYAEIIDAVDSALDSTSDNVDGLGSADSETPADKAVFEVLDRREETVKHFRDADGSYVAAQYDCPVHELDANGEWQDIDNTLVESGSEYATPNARVKFAKKITGNETLFTLHDGNRKITMSMSGANKKVAGQVTNTYTEFGEEATKLQKLMTLDRLSSRILYPEILDDVDLEYVVQPDSIKENIIVKEKGDEYRYSFDIRLNNLTATLQEDGSVCIADPNTNEVVYVIPAGYMFDGADEYSDAVQYELADNGSGKYTLTVTADAEWINDEERVFPVTIDPSIEYDNDLYGSVVESTYVASGTSSTNYSTDSYLYAGSHSTNGYYITYIRMKSLPTLPNNAAIAEATLSMSVWEFAGEPVYIGLYPVTGFWQKESVTYSNKPGHMQNPLDYKRISNAGSTEWDMTSLVDQWYDGAENYGVALTSITASSSTRYAKFRSERKTASVPSIKIIYRDTKGIESYYSYYSSQADMAGSGHVHALTGNLAFVHSSISSTDEILPYSVELTYNSCLSNQEYMTGGSIHTPIERSSVGLGFKMSYDETIQQLDVGADIELFIWADSDGTEHYFSWQSYTARSGTVRSLCDEDGLGLYLELEYNDDANDNSIQGYMLSDDAGNKKHFNSSGYLEYIEDTNGNQRIFERDENNQVTCISLKPNGEDVIDQIKIYHDHSGRVLKIKNQQTALRATMYYSSTYNGAVSTSESGYLRKIIYTYAAEHTYTVTFEYNSSGKLILVKDLNTGRAIEYIYNTSGETAQIKQYANATESSTTADMVPGKKARINYGTLYSYYETPGADGTMGNSDDIQTCYRFDYSGRVISSYTEDSNHLYGAANRVYEDDTSVKKKNSISSVMQLGGNTVNYLLNPGFEQIISSGDEDIPIHWTVNNESYCFTNVHSSDNYNTYLHLIATSNTRTAKATQTFKVPVGTYTASATFDRTDLKQNGKARLVIKDNAGIVVGYSDYVLPFETNRITTDVKETKSVTFIVDDTDCATYGWTLEIELSFISTPSSGETETILVDDVMLEKSAGASRYSSLGNGGFEVTTSGSAITDWTLSNAARGTTVRDDNYSVKVTGSPSTPAYARNRVHFNAYSQSATTNSPESYVVSGWAKGDSARTSYTSIGASNQSCMPVFALKAVVHYAGISATTTTYIPFDDDNTNWQFATGTVSAEKKDGSGNYYRISSIDVYCCYDYNINTAYFDNISLVKDANSVTHYEYNDYGYVSNVTTSDGNGVDYTYASNDVDIIGATSTDGNTVGMGYDDNHRLTTETNLNGPNNYTIAYEYNDYGQVSSTTVSSGNFAMLSSSTYSTGQTNFGAVLTSTDPNAQITRMFYDSKARLIGTCANDNTGLIYTYDKFGRVTKVEEATYNASTGAMQAVSGGSSVSSTYDDNAHGVLSAIETATAQYDFTYDAFGNMTEISVNGYTLSLNTYAAKNGNLTETEYGNGDSVTYSYDNIDRITNVCYNDDDTDETAVFTYTYNANGDLSSHTDSINGETHVYTYDAKGNIAQRIVKDKTTNEVKRVEQYTYDDQGRTSSVDYSYVNTTDVPTLVHYGYEYDVTGNLTNAKYVGASAQTAYTYDTFGRLSTETLQTLGGSQLFKRRYRYVSELGNTSGRIASVALNPVANQESAELTTLYSYDDVGNIIGITLKDSTNTEVLKYTYEYDDKGQLTRENILDANLLKASRTTVYTYDDSGNILSKNKYAYTEAATVTGTPIVTYSYGYASTWGDQLTSYNGTSISYDAIGNPTSYGNYMYDWKYGRQLASISNSSTGLLVTYQYNDEGIRTVKTVNGVRHEYDVMGGQINREVIRSSSDESSAVLKDIRYYYDAAGRPVAIRVFARNNANESFPEDGDIYYLQTNLQGDVVGIYNKNGTKIYEYAYDAWGNIIKSAEVVTGGNAAHAVNPFRYRGYYYDTETGLYYLQSRYYNPEWGRFLNADVYVNANGDLLGYNMFAYCSNNPVMYSDPNGKGIWNWLKQLFGFGSDESERGTQFTSDCYTLPQDMNPYLDFRWDINSACMENYSLVDQYYASYTIDDIEAKKIQDRTAVKNCIFGLIEGVLYSPFVNIVSQTKITKVILTAVSTATQVIESPGPNVSNGTYHVIVGLYKNSNGDSFMVRRIYSDYKSSDYNLGWHIITEHDPSKPLSYYARRNTV